MGKEKKKQHYVPQCYLEQWSVPDKHQLYVYNKKQKRSYLASICDVASERYFYDFDFTGIFTEDDLKKYGLNVCDPKHVDDGQYIENYFSKEVEVDLKNHLTKIVNRTNQMTPWEINNCFFTTEKDKFHMSFQLALQYIRVKSVRNAIADSDNCLKQALVDMGAPSGVIEKYTMPQSRFSSYIHGKMILDREHIDELAQCFFSLTWVLWVNSTSCPLFTSDNPIGTKAHIYDPIIPMSGLKSRGVEAYFPLAPNLMLLMFDSGYHTFIQGRDRRIIELRDIEVVKAYNSRCVLNSDTCIFSNTDDFSIIDGMLSKDPKVLDTPHTVLHWGGHTYTPQRGNI